MILEILAEKRNKILEENTSILTEQSSFVDELVFVYGSLKKGYSNNRVLGPSELLGTASTISKYFMTTNGAFPYVSETKKTTIIHGEVYRVTNQQVMRNLDRLEGYNEARPKEDSLYYRKKITVSLNGKNVEASTYFSDRGLKYPQIKDGVFTQVRKEEIKFTAKDLKGKQYVKSVIGKWYKITEIKKGIVYCESPVGGQEELHLEDIIEAH